MFLNFRIKEGRIHQTSCPHATYSGRLIPIPKGALAPFRPLIDAHKTGWFGPWGTYEEARTHADLLSEFKIWDCAMCHPERVC
jgi:hypothetical protein